MSITLRNVKGAPLTFAEMDANWTELLNSVSTVESSVTDHLEDSDSAHAASAISFAGGVYPDVQTAVESISVALGTEIDTHRNDETEAHFASAIGFLPPAGMTAENVQVAIEDLFANITYGTWTPTLLGTSSDPTITTNLAAGSWLKIGKRVFFTGRLWTATVSGGSGSALIGGLPYEVANDAGRGVVTFGFVRNFTSATSPLAGWMNLGAGAKNAFLLYRKASADARDALSTALTVAEWLGTSDVAFSGHYEAAS